MGIVIIGHRGMGPTSTLPSIEPETLPENSLAAFARAFEHGADGIEFDVHVTKDGEVAVIHDNILNKKIAGADRDATNLGLVSSYTMGELSQMDVGNGQGIPSLNDVMDLMISEGATYTANTGKTLMIDIELKGEGVAEPVYRTIKPYIDAGYVQADDFVFNSFNWDNLRELRALDPDFKLIPAIRTEDLFGKENVTMPGWKVKEGADYQLDAFARLRSLHGEINCHAFDCIVFDLRQTFVDFCASSGIGLFTSTSAETVKAERIRAPLALMVAAENRLPVVCFRADHAGETRALVADIKADMAGADMAGADIDQKAQTRTLPAKRAPR
ncbi:MAG: glycerophosphodiester phosphodiesterase [Alphaproteobacteria bacterium]